jgi:hypothetical protein
MNTKILLSSIAMTLMVVASAAGQREDDSGRASKNGRTEGEIDGVSVVVEYGRPNAKGRDLWGALVPYGKVWRTGADEASTISLSGDVEINGESLAAGTYAVFTIPSESSWTVIFNKTAKQWGAFRYDEGEDALRVDVQPGSGEYIESMDFQIDGSQVVLRWGDMRVPIEITGAD